MHAIVMRGIIVNIHQYSAMYDVKFQVILLAAHARALEGPHTGWSTIVLGWVEAIEGRHSA